MKSDQVQINNQSRQCFDDIDAYIRFAGGTTPIRRILIANNGIAAVKAIRSIRRWAYETFGNERQIHFTVMTTPEDLKANAEYIRMADEFVEVDGGSNNNNYANVKRIIDTAEAVHADAVWAGWGHASENPSLPDNLKKSLRKIVFIGPSGDAMRALGDKIGSTIIAQSANVPTIAWNGQGIRVNFAKEGLPASLFEKANVKTLEQAKTAAESVGFPLMIKASEGGGGKGIRKVLDASGLEAAFRQVQSEVPGSPIFLMRLVNNARHLEVQVLADQYGEAISLSGRDCSVQRRHQKIIEEGPVLAAPTEVWREMEAAAVRLAKEVNYANAGTVEYLFQESDSSFAFLELNPRLQVEHPVTEMITGVNLPAAQLQVAMGIPLHRIPDVRKLYHHDPFGDSPIEFHAKPPQLPGGHVIAARITAENPERGFQPTSGAVTELNFRSTPDVWGYFSVDSSGRVHEFADSQIGHLFGWGPTREDARRNMSLALKELSIRGDIRTTVEYLVSLMEADDFKSNHITTEWLDRRIQNNVISQKPDPLLVVVAGGIVKGFRKFEARAHECSQALIQGRVPSAEQLSLKEDMDLIYDNVKYTLTVAMSGPNLISVQCNNSLIQAEMRVLTDGGMLILLGGKSHVVYGTEEPTGLRLLVDGATCIFTQEYDPTELRGAMSGKLARYLVDQGAHVAANTAYAEVEVMKMYMPLVVPEAGTITLVKPEGSVLEPGEVIARVDLDDPSTVRKSELFLGTLPQCFDVNLSVDPAIHNKNVPRDSSAMQTRKSHTVAKRAMYVLENVMRGYDVPLERMYAALRDRDLAFTNPYLSLLEFEHTVSVLASRLPATLTEQLHEIALTCRNQTSFSKSDVKSMSFPVHSKELDWTKVQKSIQATRDELPPKEHAAFNATVLPLTQLVEKFKNGIAECSRRGLLDLLSMFMSVESMWSEALDTQTSTHKYEKRDDDVVADLRKTYSTDCSEAHDVPTAFGDNVQDNSIRRGYAILRAHAHLTSRVRLAVEILRRIAEEIDGLKTWRLRAEDSKHLSSTSIAVSDHGRNAFSDEEQLLHQVAELRGLHYADVTLEARQALVRIQQPSSAERLASVEHALRTSKSLPDAPASLVQWEQPLIDVLIAYFSHHEHSLRQQAVHVYIRRLYRAYNVSNFTASSDDNENPLCFASWTFSSQTTNAESSKPKANNIRTSGGIVPADSYDNLALAQKSNSRSQQTDSYSTTCSAGPHVHGLSPHQQRCGAILVFRNVDDLNKHLVGALSKFSQLVTNSPELQQRDAAEAKHVLHIVLLSALDTQNDAAESFLKSTEEQHGTEDDAVVVSQLEKLLAPHRDLLSQCGVRRVTFLLSDSKHANFSANEASNLAPEEVYQNKIHEYIPFQSTEHSMTNVIPHSAVNAAIEDQCDTPVSQAQLRKFTGFPRIFTLRSQFNFSEDPTVRDIEPPLSGYLELNRLSNFDVRLVTVPNRSVHVYAAVPKSDCSSPKPVRGAPRQRFFVRTIVRQSAHLQQVSDIHEQFPGPERMFVDAIDALDIAMGDALQDTRSLVGGNHIFLNVLPTAKVEVDYVESVIRKLARRYADRLRRSRVSQVEFKLNVQPHEHSPIVPVRLVSSNPTGYVLRVDTYIEARRETSSVPIFSCIPPSSYANEYESELSMAGILDGSQTDYEPLDLSQSRFRAGSKSTHQSGELDGKPITSPYPVSTPFEAKRSLAAAMSDTVWCYDFIDLFEKAVEQQWVDADQQKEGRSPRHVRSFRALRVRELILRKQQSPSVDTAGSSKGTAASGRDQSLRRNFSDIFSNEMGPAVQTSSNSDNLQNATNSESVSSTQMEENKPTNEPEPSDSSANQATYTLQPTERPPGRNTIGMVAWHLTLYTPTFPEEIGGRDIVVIANDITHRAGSFGTLEDRLFQLATEYASERGIPRIYLAANSGARIGLASEVKECFQVAWIDSNDPSRGFEYLYLSEHDHERLSAANSVNCKRIVTPDGETRYQIQDIIGTEPDLGVENLRGSGIIAGETSRAYKDIFTLTYVSGRSVGIGAYLVRLGQRVIQKVTSAPILLTGYEALNKLIGNQVYSSNLQLGGPKVMYTNGVTHQIVHNDLEGILAVLQWLNYIPRARGAPLPIAELPLNESVDREVDFSPNKGQPYDPRALIQGENQSQPENTDQNETEGTKFLHGVFDDGSFTETMGGWAKTVVCGRARLGGIPMGVIVAETRAVNSVTPADPATPSSHESITQQAGQVWYPDSAYKTSQAIRDFASEGLPLMIFANWRGFSGGQRDMFDQVLKFGSYIVDALVDYSQPVFVYIPPHGELRGGAWVVVDPSINSECMEMYSDVQGRGGVLEPSGVASIKFRKNDLLKSMHRLDASLRHLSAELSQSQSPEVIEQIKAKIKAREQSLLAVYLQTAHTFADLHDTPGRMLAKGVIRAIVPWKRARSFFYWRLRRRLAEFALRDRLIRVAPQLSRTKALGLIRSWFDDETIHQGSLQSSRWNDDLQVLRWLADSRDLLETKASQLHRESVRQRVINLGNEDPHGVVSGVVGMLQRLSADEREAAVGALRRAVLFETSLHDVSSMRPPRPIPNQNSNFPRDALVPNSVIGDHTTSFRRPHSTHSCDSGDRIMF